MTNGIQSLDVSTQEGVSEGQARQILGKDFLGPDEVSSWLKQEWGMPRGRILDRIPYSKTFLRSCRGTYILVPGFPISILELRDSNAGLLYSRGPCWYMKERFSRRRVSGSWYLLRKHADEAFLCKSLAEQKLHLDSKHRVAYACEVVFAALLYFVARGHRLFEDTYARCEDMTSEGTQVCVGNFSANGLDIDDCWLDDHAFDLGLAIVRV